MEERHGEILIYQTEDGLTKINVKMQDETVWLTQQQLAELYQSSKSNVSEHIKHIFEEGELDEESVVRKFRTTASDGKNYSVIHYNLDMILSSGNRKLLTGAGKVSHDEAMKKAKEEYKKYQAITLSPVGQAYMETIKDAGESAKKKDSEINTFPLLSVHKGKM